MATIQSESPILKLLHTAAADSAKLRHGLAWARDGLAVPVRRVKAEIVTSNAVAGLILAAVFATTALTILLLRQVMLPWRAALVTSGIMAVIGFSLLQAQMIMDVAASWVRLKRIAGDLLQTRRIVDLTTSWVRLKSIGADVAGRVTELIRTQLRAR